MSKRHGATPCPARLSRLCYSSEEVPMTSHFKPPPITRPRALGVLLVAVVLMLGLNPPAGAATVAALATTSTVSVSPTPHAYGSLSRAFVTVRDAARHAPPGSTRFYLDGRLYAVVPLGIDGRATVLVPSNAAIGRRVLSAQYVPAANSGHAASAGRKAFDVIRAIPRLAVHLPYQPTYAGAAAINVSVAGVVRVTGTVALTLGGRVLARANVATNGSVAFRVRSSWSAGTARFGLSYSGDRTFVPSSTSFLMATTKAPTSMTLSVPSSLRYATGTRATVSVAGVGAPLAGRVTLLVDGTARSAAGVVSGPLSLPVPALRPGRHTVTASYTGDTNHVAVGRSAVVTAGSAPLGACPATARACVDLTHSLTWLQSGGRIVYGPVPLTSGRPGYRTWAGTFQVYWKDIDHHSSEFNGAPMPYSVFFDGGIAFHEGSLSVPSHGCIHLSNSAARQYFSYLHVGDRVFVFGHAPY